jgi:hypothetical protein
VRAELRAAPAALFGLAIVTTSLLSGCGKKLAPEVSAAVEAQRAVAMKVATDAAKACPGMKGSAPFQANPMAAPPAPPNPAKGTSLETDPKVLDVYIMCSWPDPRAASTWAGTGWQPLRGTSSVPLLAVTMPEDSTETTCLKNAHDCVQVVTPSRYSKSAQSADLRIVKPTADGGDVEVRVAIVVP